MSYAHIGQACGYDRGGYGDCFSIKPEDDEAVDGFLSKREKAIHDGSPTDLDWRHLLIGSLTE